MMSFRPSSKPTAPGSTPVATAATPSTSRSLLLSAVGNIAPPAAILVTSPVLARTLGVDGRGELAAALAPYLLAIAIGTIGLPEAITRAVAIRPQLWRSLVPKPAIAMVTSGLLCSTIVITATTLTSESKGVVSATVLGACAITPCLIVSVLRGAAQGLNMWSIVALERLLNGTLRVVPIVALAVTNNLTLFTATACMAFGPAAAIVAYIALLRRHYPLITSNRDSDTSFSSLLHYGLRVWIGSIAGILLLRIDQLLMAVISVPRELGLYVVAVSISEVPLVASTAFREVMFTKDSESSDNDSLTRAARSALIVCTFIGLIVSLTSYYWIPLLFGAEFDDAFVPALLLTAAVVVGVPGSIAGSGLSARGHPGLRSLSLLVACVCNIGAICILAPPLGATGVALATLIGNLVSANGNIVFMRTIYGTPVGDYYAVRPHDVRDLATKGIRLAAKSSS
jgi:O-antigen/teichoic acid export membrane protein